MKVASLLLICILSLTACEYSGIKAAIDSGIFRVLTKFDLNSILANMTVLDEAQASGQALFNYEVDCKNLTITNIVNPTSVDLDSGVTEEGLPSVTVKFNEIAASIQIDYLYVKYGLIKETFNNPTGSVTLDYIQGEYYFTSDGKIVIKDFQVEINDMDIDVKKDFLNFLIDLFKGLIKSQVEKKLKDLGETFSNLLNDWVDGEFLYDLGMGIGFNLTNTLKPALSLVTQPTTDLKVLSLLATALLGSSDLFEYHKTIVTFGIHGSVYPNLNPDLKPDLEPAADMPFETSYYTNELQVLISEYSLNTLLFMGQNTGILHREFTNTTHELFPWNFDTVGLREILPQFETKYPEGNYEVQMKAYISVFNHLQPLISSTTEGAKLTLHFNLDFLTTVSDDPFDDPEEDLSLNVVAELPFSISIKYELLTINWGGFTVTKLEKIKDQLGCTEEELTTMIQNMWDSYVTKFLKGYTKNVALASILTLLTGMEWKNLKLETREKHLLASIALKLD